MPTTVVLGRNQSLTLDGEVLEGTREFDIDIDIQTHDVTYWSHKWKSSLPVSGDLTCKLLIYWKDNYDKFFAKLNTHPPRPMVMNITNVGTFGCVPTKVGIKGPINGVMAWEVELRLWCYA